METGRLLHEELSQSVIGAFFEVHTTLGFGFLETTYTAALEIELRERGHVVRREVPAEVRYKGRRVGFHRIDMIVDDILVIEVKSTAVLSPTARRQLLNYLRVTRVAVGLVLHFGPKPRVYREICTW